MKYVGLLYQASMVRALLAGIKTQTRRVLSERHLYHFIEGQGDLSICPYGQPGDRLWVKETHYSWGRWEKRFSEEKGRDEWHFIDMTLESGRNYRYAADVSVITMERRATIPGWHKRPAIFMPRVASRITLEVTGVRVERLQDISEADALAEGAERHIWDVSLGAAELIDWPLKDSSNPYRNGYALLWEQINGPGSWDDNPWVWVVEFRRLR